MGSVILATLAEKQTHFYVIYRLLVDGHETLCRLVPDSLTVHVPAALLNGGSVARVSTIRRRRLTLDDAVLTETSLGKRV